jgi:hypothetical protein
MVKCYKVRIYANGENDRHTFYMWAKNAYQAYLRAIELWAKAFETKKVLSTTQTPFNLVYNSFNVTVLHPHFLLKEKDVVTEYEVFVSHKVISETPIYESLLVDWTWEFSDIRTEDDDPDGWTLVDAEDVPAVLKYIAKTDRSKERRSTLDFDGDGE